MPRSRSPSASEHARLRYAWRSALRAPTSAASSFVAAWRSCGWASPPESGRPSSRDRSSPICSMASARVIPSLCRRAGGAHRRRGAGDLAARPARHATESDHRPAGRVTDGEGPSSRRPSRPNPESLPERQTSSCRSIDWIELDADSDEPIRTWIGQRAEQHGMDDAEDVEQSPSLRLVEQQERRQSQPDAASAQSPLRARACLPS